MDVLLLTHAFSCTSTELETETRVPDNQEPQPIASTSETIPSPFIGIAGISERKLGILRQDLEFYHVQPFDPLDRRCIEEEGATAENEEPQWRIAVAVKNSDLTLQSIERLLIERATLEAELAACKQQLQEKRNGEEPNGRRSVGETTAQYWKRRAGDLQLEVHALRSHAAAAESLRVRSEAAVEKLARDYAQDFRRTSGEEGEPAAQKDRPPPLERRPSGSFSLERRNSMLGVDGLRTDEVLNKLEAVIDQLASGNMLLDKVTSHPQTLARPMKAG